MCLSGASAGDPGIVELHKIDSVMGVQLTLLTDYKMLYLKESKLTVISYKSLIGASQWYPWTRKETWAAEY